MIQYQVSVWIAADAYKQAARKLEEAKRKSGVGNITLSALCGSTLEKALK